MAGLIGAIFNRGRGAAERSETENFAAARANEPAGAGFAEDQAEFQAVPQQTEAAAKPPEEANRGMRLDNIRSEFDRFSGAFSREIALHAALYTKLENDHVKLDMRHAALAQDCRQAREDLEIARSEGSALRVELARMRSDYADVSGRLEKISTELQVARDQVQRLDFRRLSLESDHSAAVHECDRRDVELIGARQELSDIAQLYESAKVKLEHARQREAEIEARSQMFDVEIKDLRPRLEHIARRAAHQNESILTLEAQLGAATSDLQIRDRQAAELEAERNSLRAACNTLSANLDEARAAGAAKLDAVSKTKNFLWSISEKQRKQIADQTSRISSLENSNSRLSQQVLDATLIENAAPGHEAGDPASAAAPVKPMGSAAHAVLLLNKVQPMTKQ